MHSAQGQTADRALIEADTKSLTANESSYYVAISRARDGVTIYTDDKTMLPETMRTWPQRKWRSMPLLLANCFTAQMRHKPRNDKGLAEAKPLFCW